MKKSILLKLFVYALRFVEAIGISILAFGIYSYLKSLWLIRVVKVTDYALEAAHVQLKLGKSIGVYTLPLLVLFIVILHHIKNSKGN